MHQGKSIESSMVIFLLSCWMCQSFCCLYEGQLVEASLNNSTFVASARSTVECTLQCQRFKKTPFYTNDEKCYCLKGLQASDNNSTHLGITFKKVIFEDVTNTEIEKPKPNSIVNYTMIGTLSMMCANDPGAECEYYGTVSLSIGQRPENQNLKVWSLSKSNWSRQPQGKPWTVTFFHKFEEYESYVTDAKEFIILDGEIRESDSTNSDLIADFSGEVIAVTDVFESFKATRVTNGNDYAEVILRINTAV